MRNLFGKWYYRILVVFVLSIIIFLSVKKYLPIIIAILTIFAFIDKILNVSLKNKEKTIIKKIIEKTPSWMEEHLRQREQELQKMRKRERQLSKIILRLKSSIKDAGISVEEIIKHYDKPLNAILLYKFRERLKNKKVKYIPQKLIELGFKPLQNGIYILPPARMPKELNTTDELRKWMHQNVIAPIDGNLEYVFPFVAIIDLRKVFSEKRAPENAWGKTIFGVLDLDEVFSPEIVWSYLMKRRVTIKELIKLGDFVFLATPSCSQDVVKKLDTSKAEIKKRLQKVLGKEEMMLDDIANMNIQQLSKVLKGVVKDENKTAKAIIREAVFWNNFLKSV